MDQVRVASLEVYQVTYRAVVDTVITTTISYTTSSVYQNAPLGNPLVSAL